MGKNNNGLTNESGFTMLEMMIVVGIIVILASIATPNAIAWYRNSLFNDAVREIKGAIENTRMIALRTNLNSRLQFTDGSNAFNTQQLDRTGTWNVSNAYQLSPDVAVSSNFVSDLLTFNNRGMATPTGTITIQNGNGLCQAIVVNLMGGSRIDTCP